MVGIRIYITNIHGIITSLSSALGVLAMQMRCIYSIGEYGALVRKNKMHWKWQQNHIAYSILLDLDPDELHPTKDCPVLTFIP